MGLMSFELYWNYLLFVLLGYLMLKKFGRIFGAVIAFFCLYYSMFVNVLFGNLIEFMYV